MRASGVLVLCAAGAGAAWGFSNYAVGDVLPEVSLPGLDGKKRPFIGTKAKANVFFFFRPGQKHSEQALTQLAALEKEFAEKPVAFVGIVSSVTDAAEVKQMVADATLTAPVLVDDNDGLYGKLGTALTPVVGVTDDKRKLVAYLPFHKLYYPDLIRAWVRFTLGEITKEQLQTLLTPPPSIDGGPVQVARRYMNMADRQFKSGNVDGALASLKRSFEASQEVAGAHALFGKIKASQGKCDEAVPAFNKALELEPMHEGALAGLTGCGAGGRAAAATPDAGTTDAGTGLRAKSGDAGK